MFDKFLNSLSILLLCRGHCSRKSLSSSGSLAPQGLQPIRSSLFRSSHGQGTHRHDQYARRQTPHCAPGTLRVKCSASRSHLSRPTGVTSLLDSHGDLHTSRLSSRLSLSAEMTVSPAIHQLYPLPSVKQPTAVCIGEGRPPAAVQYHSPHTN